MLDTVRAALDDDKTRRFFALDARTTTRLHAATRRGADAVARAVCLHLIRVAGLPPVSDTAACPLTRCRKKHVGRQDV